MRPAWTPSMLLPKHTLVIPLCAVRTSTGNGSNGQSLCAWPPSDTLLLAGRRPCLPWFWCVSPRTSAPPARISRSLLVNIASILPTTVYFFSSVTQRRRSLSAHNDRRDARLVFRQGVYSHIRASAHVLLNPAGLPLDCVLLSWCGTHDPRVRFYWCVEMSICTLWWLGSCLKCHERKSSWSDVCSSIISMPLTSGPGMVITVD